MLSISDDVTLLSGQVHSLQDEHESTSSEESSSQEFESSTTKKNNIIIINLVTRGETEVLAFMPAERHA